MGYIDQRRRKGEISADCVGHPRMPEDEPKHASQRGPACPECGKSMVLRIAGQGKHLGKRFWGCSAFPDCTAIRDYDPADPTTS